MKLDTLKDDFNAGFSVALIALPLPIGISLASGAPASAGIIAAIIGGMLGSWLGGAHVTINGPAAGLIVIIIDASMDIGKGDVAAGFRGMLAAAVVAGALQVILGLLKMGRKGLACPSSVINGMMTSIGIIIIAKQAHLVMGHTPVAKNPLLQFAELPTAFSNFTPNVFIIGGTSLAFLTLLNNLKGNVVKKLPGSLLTVILGSLLVYFFPLPASELLVVPADVSKWIIFPDFSAMSTYAGWKATITICLVASLESVLVAAGVDKIDPEKRKSDLDRELFSKGVCNMASGLVGGLPMIAEIVRSAASISYGARTWKANFFHGTMILSAVLIFPSSLNLIPIASLAAVLIIVGSRLGNPKQFLTARAIGPDNFIGFMVTLMVTLAFDLLLGIIVGIIVQFFVQFFMGLKVKHVFKAAFTCQDRNNQITFTFQSSLTFSNFLKIKEEILRNINLRKNVVLDFQHSAYIDHTVLEQIHEVKRNFNNEGLELSILYADDHRPVGPHPLSAMKKSETSHQVRPAVK